MKQNVLKICVTAAGIALFVVLSLCLQVPVFENYYLCLGYVAMAVWCFSFGTVPGTIVGVLGTVLYCVVISGLRGMPGWALGNIVIGLALGLTFHRTENLKNSRLRAVLYGAAVIGSVTIGILGVKSLTESLLYGQPLLLRIGKNFYAWAADIFVLLVSLPLCVKLDPLIRKSYPELVRRHRTASLDKVE